MTTEYFRWTEYTWVNPDKDWRKADTLVAGIDVASPPAARHVELVALHTPHEGCGLYLNRDTLCHRYGCLLLW